MAASEYIVSAANLRAMADAIRQKTGQAGLITPNQMAAAIAAIPGGGGGVEVEPLNVTTNGVYPAPAGKAFSPVTVNVPAPDPGKWVRPSDWPDLDSITMPSYDCIYLTYDLRKTPGYGWIGLYAVTDGNKKWIIERGTLNASGNFTADTYEEINNYGTYRAALNAADGDVQLFRVRGVDDANIKDLYFRTNTETQASNFRNSFQPCVERRGKAHISNTSVASGFGPNANAFFGDWIERENFYFDGSGALANNAYQRKIKLHSLSVSGPRVEAGLPNITGLNGLKELTYTNGTVVSGLYNSINYLYSMRSLNLSGLNTSSVTNANLFLSNSMGLEEIDLSSMDLSAVTTTSNILGGASKLKSFKATGMKISNAVNIQVGSMESLEDFWPWNMLEKSIDFSACIYLTRDSLLRIIDALPAVSSTVTLTLGQNNTLKLTAAEIAVATGKGWTVA